MDLMEKEVCLICSSGNIILTFDTALSLMLEDLKTNAIYCVNENGLNSYINLVNKFIELGNKEDNSIVLEYIINNEDIEYDEDSEIYSLIIGGLEKRINFINQNTF